MARLAFLGTPDAAVRSLDALVEAGHHVRLVVSQPDTRRGRGTARTPSPVARRAGELGLAVSDHLDDVLHAGAELGVVVAYGKIIPARILDQLAMVNVHFSLLPRWRGAAPVERAILAGDDTTGVCVMRLEAGLDTGPVLGCRELAMGDEHAGALTDALARLGAEVLVELLADGVDRLGPGRPQHGEASYAAKIDAADLEIDWASPAANVHRLVRLDRAWTSFRGKRLRVLDTRPCASDVAGPPGHLVGTAVATGQGALELVVVQPEGRAAMDATAWARGARPAADEILGA